MWTAQTYLGAHVGKATYFMYLLVEDYISEQESFGNAVVENLRQLGMRTGHESAIFAPDDCAKEHIRQELMGLFGDELMSQIGGKTPGILMTDKNLSELEPEKDRWVFLSLTPFMENSASKSLPKFFIMLEKQISQSKDLLENITGSKSKKFWEESKSRFMFEPNFYGIGMRGRKKPTKIVISANVG